MLTQCSSLFLLEVDSRNSEAQLRYVGAVAVVVLHQGGRYKVHSRWHVEK